MENVKDIWSFKSQTEQEKYKTDQMGNFSMKMATTEEKAFSLNITVICTLKSICKQSQLFYLHRLYTCDRHRQTSS